MKNNKREKKKKTKLEKEERNGWFVNMKLTRIVASMIEPSVAVIIERQTVFPRHIFQSVERTRQCQRIEETLSRRSNIPRASIVLSEDTIDTFVSIQRKIGDKV